MIEKLIPAVRWLRAYRRSDLPGDLSAGVTVAVMLIPQGMAYAMLAGLPPVYGLYASTLPLLVYALFGSSRQLAVGPVAIVSLLTLSGVGALAEPGSGEFIALAALLALMTGVLQLVLGLVRAGFVVNFLSHAVISGFTSAAAIVIGLSQLKHLLGVPLESGHSVFGLLREAVIRLPETNLLTLAIGVGSILMLVGARKLAPRFPAPLAVVGLATVVTWFFGLDRYGVSIVGEVPGGIPALALPALDLGALGALAGIALTITFVGFMESVAVAKKIAAREKYRIDANQELKALGLANIAASVFSGYPVTGGFSRSAVNYQAGARTGLATMITAGLVLVTLLAFTGLFHYLPNAVLAAIVMVAVYGLIDVAEARHLFAVKRIDGWTLALTFLATLVVGIEQGIVIGVVFSLLVFIWRSAYPHVAKLGYLTRERVFRNVERYPEARTFPGTRIVRVDSSLYFANTAFLEDYLNAAVFENPGLRNVVLDFSGVNDIDAVAVETLEELIEGLHAQDVEVHIAAMKGPVRDVTGRAGWPEKFGGRVAHYSVEGALRALGVWDEADRAARGRGAVPGSSEAAGTSTPTGTSGADEGGFLGIAPGGGGPVTARAPARTDARATRAADRRPTGLAEHRQAAQAAPAADTRADEALRRLMEGNQRFAARLSGRGDPIAEPRPVRPGPSCAQGQSPFAVVLGCSDSRVPPQLVFDQDPGDLFTTRVAGNVATDAVIASIEYAAVHLGVPLVMVLGHTCCGAVSACVAGEAADGHLDVLMGRICPAVAATRDLPGDPVANAVRANVVSVVEVLRASRPVLAPLVERGELRIVGGVYDLDTGRVEIVA